MSGMTGYEAITGDAAAWIPDSGGHGHFEVAGPDANAMVNRLTTADLSRLSPGGATESLLLGEDAGIIARVDVIRFEDRVMLRSDGLPRGEIWRWLVARKRGNLRLRDISADVTAVDVIGPAAAARLGPLLDRVPAGAGLHERGRFAGVDVFAVSAPAGRPAGISMYCRSRDLPAVRRGLAGLAVPVVGDDLMSLMHVEWGRFRVGVELDRGDTPLEAGLEHLVAAGKGASFPGEVALATRSRIGALRCLVGFRMSDGGGIPEIGSPVSVSGREFDRVRSAALSPQFGAIGITAVPAGYDMVGSELAVADGPAMRPAEMVRLPFAGRAGAGQ